MIWETMFIQVNRWDSRSIENLRNMTKMGWEPFAVCLTKIPIAPGGAVIDVENWYLRCALNETPDFTGEKEGKKK